jgi:transposase-like protein
VFTGACLLAEASVGELCLRHGISRKTRYKWLERYRLGGCGWSGRPIARASQGRGIGYFDIRLLAGA